MSDLIKERQQTEQQALLENLKKTPIIQLACEKSGIGRTTYYRWLKEDADFAAQAKEALKQGTEFMNDYAESQLLSAIKDKNLTAIIFWLKNKHKDYSTRIELTGHLQSSLDPLTAEQKELVNKAISLIALPKIKESVDNDGAN